MLFAFGRIGPLRLDPDIILCLPLGERRIGRVDSARGAAEELYDDAGQPGLHAVAMLDDQIDNLVAQAPDEGRPPLNVRAVRGHLIDKLLHHRKRHWLNRVEQRRTECTQRFDDPLALGKIAAIAGHHAHRRRAIRH